MGRIFSDLRKGKFIVLLDSKREGEGDLVIAAEKATAKSIAFMLNNAKGFVCLTIRDSRRKELGIPMMVSQNTEAYQTPFTVAVSTKDGGSGTSAQDRIAAVRMLLDPKTKPSDIAQPGHLHVLSARENGLFARIGHTEAGSDLADLSGLKPASIICEIMNGDGTMASPKQVYAFAKKHGLATTTVEDVLEYRRAHQNLVRREAEAFLPTKFGKFRIIAYSAPGENTVTVALVKGSPRGKESAVRVHSECLTGEVFHSLKCDCSKQLDEAMRRIQNETHGVLVYLRQEGRGIGLANKIRAYSLQDNGLDTVEANQRLGFPADSREYWVAAQILKDLGVKTVRLLTNNPEKVKSLKKYGIKVARRLPLEIRPDKDNAGYLYTKKKKMRHLLSGGDAFCAQ